MPLFSRLWKNNAPRVAALVLAVATTLAAAGCTMGFTNFHPGENSALYQELFQDVISAYDEPYWLWVRGTISGDLNGNGIVDEEAILATIQKGTPQDPGPIEIAFLVACDIAPDGKRTARARTLLFDRSPIAAAPRPVNDLGIVVDKPFTRCRAQMVQDKVTLTETVVVYFWSDPTPSSVWYAGFALKDSGWVKNLEAVLWQSTPGFLTANLDRSVDASPFGYQLVFGVAAIPEAIFSKIGPPREAPLWGHVYARDADGIYSQADDRFGDQYRQLESAWNQVYLKAVIKGLPPEELAWFEYHMAIMNHYTGNEEMAHGFIRKAKRYARDPVLIRAVDMAFELVGLELPE